MTRRDTLKLGVTAALSHHTFSQTMPNHPTSDICFMRAVDLLAAIRTKKLSAREVIEAHLSQIHRLNPKVNAIVTLVPEDQLLAQAAAADEAVRPRQTTRPLARSAPSLSKISTKPPVSAPLMVPRCTKTPFPISIAASCNAKKPPAPSSLAKPTCLNLALAHKPSTKSSAPLTILTTSPKPAAAARAAEPAALACGMVPLADGSDMGGSLRNPPNFCNVVGIRPSAGRVSNVPTHMGWFTLAVQGPVARNVTDCAFFPQCTRRFDHHSPISIDQTGRSFLATS